MQFLITFRCVDALLPIQYQYPLSSAIYKILKNADTRYADFLHQSGYGKGFKLFSFSDLKGKFKLEGDRLKVLGSQISFYISFHLPEASQHFIKGLFLSQQITIADKKSKVTGVIQTVEALRSPFINIKDNEIIELRLQTASACVAGVKNDKGHYLFLSPHDERFAQSLLHNWKEKIKTIYPVTEFDTNILSIEILYGPHPPHSRLVTIKQGTPAETKIRGFTNFALRVLGHKKFVELLYNSGVGLYNAMGMGCVKEVRE